jgi:hypothetical protein
MPDLVVTNINDVLTASNIKVNWEKRSIYQEDPLLLSEVFPSKKVQGLQASYLKGFQEVTAALQPAAFDTKPVVGLFSLNLKNTDIDLFFFRESFVVGEKMRQDIDTFLAKGYQYAAALIQDAYEQNVKFVDKALVSTELMRAGCLTEGKFTIASSDDNGRRIINQMNYDPTNAWHENGINYVVLSGNSRWLTANAAQDDFNPYSQLQARIKAIRIATGKIIKRVYLNSTTFDAMLKSEKIRKYINPVGYANALITNNSITTFMESELGVKFILVDRVYADLNTGATTQMFPDGYVSLIPQTPVGYTCYGTTPEEHDLMNGKVSGSVDVQIVNTGVAITTLVEVGPPVQTKTVVSEVVSPTFESMDSICSMKVF